MTQDEVTQKYVDRLVSVGWPSQAAREFLISFAFEMAAAEAASEEDEAVCP